MKKIRIQLLGFLLSFTTSGYILYAETISRGDLTDRVGKIIPDASSKSGQISYTSIASEIQKWMFILVGVIAVIYIIWVGAKLLWAPGNTEEIGTAMKSLGYIMIGLALIPFAWFIVNFIIHFSI